MDRRIRLATYLAHTRRADGSWVADWTVARLALDEVRQLLRKHLASAWLPQDVTEAAHAASEYVRTFALVTADWQQV